MPHTQPKSIQIHFYYLRVKIVLLFVHGVCGSIFIVVEPWLVARGGDLHQIVFRSCHSDGGIMRVHSRQFTLSKVPNALSNLRAIAFE